jgi:antirestriction protein ArdC
MAKKKTTKKKAAGRTSSAALNTVSVEELQAELARRNRKVSSLERKRERLRQQLAEVEAELSAHGALSASGGIRKRPKNELSLVETLQKVLKGKTMSVTDAAQAARDAGYMTTAANFRTIVNQTLIRENKLFKKVSRGQYTAK